MTKRTATAAARLAAIVFAATIAYAHVLGQPATALTAGDYDDFYSRVVLQARNGTKTEWLASYDPIVNFVARVRQDVERLPEATQRAFAQAVHDNGYWKGQELRVRNPADPFLGARFRSSDAALRAVLTPQGMTAYSNRFAQGPSGYRLALDAVGDRAGLYRLEGKRVPKLSELPASTNIINANAQSWADLIADAQRFANPRERLAVIVRNQLNGIASALSLLRSTRSRTEAEMDYATAVIWRYTGHFSSRDGWDREPLVRTPYAQLSEAEKAKDRDVWKAVREALQAHPLPR